MKHDYKYQGERVLLRPLEERDSELLRQLRNRPENRCWFFYSEEISYEDQLLWYQSYLKAENDFMFAVSLPSLPRGFVGAIAIYDYHQVDDSFEIGRLLLDSKNTSCKGLGKEIVRCACRIASEQLSTHTQAALRAEVFSDNERSLRCFLTNGFQICGERIQNKRSVILLKRISNTEEKE